MYSNDNEMITNLVIINQRLTIYIRSLEDELAGKKMYTFDDKDYLVMKK